MGRLHIERLDDLNIAEIVNYHPIKIDENESIYVAEEILLNRRISTFLVSRRGKVTGVFQMFNLA